MTMTHVDLETNRGRACESRPVTPPIDVRKGDEVGIFNLGSTVVMLVEGGAWDVAAPPVGASVRMGEPLFNRQKTAR